MASFWAFYTWKPFKQRLGFKRRDFRLSQVTDKTQAVIGRIVLARLAQNYCGLATRMERNVVLVEAAVGGRGSALRDEPKQRLRRRLLHRLVDTNLTYVLFFFLSDTGAKFDSFDSKARSLPYILHSCTRLFPSQY